MGACQKAIDVLFVRIGRSIRHEGIDVGGHWRQAREVEGQPAGQRHLVGLGIRMHALLLEPAENEAVDRRPRPGGVLHLGLSGAIDAFERPVTAIFGPLGDPPLQDLSFGRRDRLVDTRRRHHDVGVGARDPRDDLALRGITRYNSRRAAIELGDGSVTHVEPQARLPVFGIRTVAGKAPIRENRPHVAVEVEAGLGCQSRRRTQQGGDRNDDRAAMRGGASHERLQGQHPRRRSAAALVEGPAVKRGSEHRARIDRRELSNCSTEPRGRQTGCPGAHASISCRIAQVSKRYFVALSRSTSASRAFTRSSSC